MNKCGKQKGKTVKETSVKEIRGEVPGILDWEI